MKKEEKIPLRKGKTFYGLLIILVLVILQWFGIDMGLVYDIAMMFGISLSAVGGLHKIDKIIGGLQKIKK